MSDGFLNGEEGPGTRWPLEEKHNANLHIHDGSISKDWQTVVTDHYLQFQTFVCLFVTNMYHLSTDPFSHVHYSLKDNQWYWISLNTHFRISPKNGLMIYRVVILHRHKFFVNGGGCSTDSEASELLSGFSDLVVSMLASGTQVRGFKPGWSRRIFRAKKSSAFLPSEGK
jgi:hypothetical protein